MALEVEKVRGSFLGWVIANFLGFGAVGVLFYFPSLLGSLSGMLVSTLVMGIPVGVAQWIALRRLTQVSISWVLSVSIGLLMALLPLSRIPDDIYGLAIASVGLLVGTVQWLLLRRHFSRALVWPLASSVGTGVAFWLVLGTGLINQSGFISAIVAVLVYTGITGLALEWMRGQRANNLGHLPMNRSGT
jgi:hypothetical protein